MDEHLEFEQAIARARAEAWRKRARAPEVERIRREMQQGGAHLRRGAVGLRLRRQRQPEAEPPHRGPGMAVLRRLPVASGPTAGPEEEQP